MDKREAIRIIASCVALYEQNLKNRNFLFLFGKEEKPSSIEVVFLPRHFLHLTGVELTGKTDRTHDGTVHGSVDFYERALNHRLRESDFTMGSNGTTEMKLTVLQSLMRIHKVSKMVGTYDSSKSLLYTEKLTGNVTACMGFVFDANIGYYVPNTALKEDIRDVTRRPQERVLCVFQKDVGVSRYAELCYIAKGLDIHNLALPEKVLRTAL